MLKPAVILVLAAVLVVGAAARIRAGQETTLDAVTMATISNPWVGEVGWLTDGRTPATDADAPGLQWEWIGLVAVSWPEAVRLRSVEVYVGELHQYHLYGYLGGGFTETGQRLGTTTAVFGCDGSLPEGVSGWFEVPCATDGLVDNLSFQVVGGALLYELRFRTADGTVIRPVGLARLKRSPLGVGPPQP